MSAPQLDQATLQQLLVYRPDDGVFLWKARPGKKAWNSRYAGKVAGFDWHPKHSGTAYRSIRIFDWPFLGHRLAWLYMTGRWPAVDVDHRDRNGLNNSWSNLREATKAQNASNTGASKNSKTGYKGVSVCKSTGRYRATIQVNRKWMWLGYFDTAEDASAAYSAASERLRGEFGGHAP